jgi:hypothetical protein
MCARLPTMCHIGFVYEGVVGQARVACGYDLRRCTRVWKGCRKDAEKGADDV